MRYINFDRYGAIEISDGSLTYVDSYAGYLSNGGLDIPDFDRFSYSATIPAIIICDGARGGYDPRFDEIIDDLPRLYAVKHEKDIAAVNKETAEKTVSAPIEEPTDEETIELKEMTERDFSNAITDWMNAEARYRGYDSFAILMTYISSSVPRWKRDAEIAVLWRDKIWMDAFTLFAAFEKGETGGMLPAFDEWVTNEPSPEWED